MCDRVFSEDFFLVVCCPNWYKTQIVRDDAVDDSLVALKFILDWFVRNKMLGKSDNDLHAHDDILFCNEYFDKVTFISNQRHIIAVDLDKTNLDNDNNFDEDDSNTITQVSLLAWVSKFEKRKALKKRWVKN